MDPELRKLLLNLLCGFGIASIVVFVYATMSWVDKRFHSSRPSQSVIIAELSKPKLWLDARSSLERSVWLEACRLQIDGIIQILRSSTPDYYDRVSNLRNILNETGLTIEDFGLTQPELDRLIRQCALAQARVVIDKLRQEPGNPTWFQSLMGEVKRCNLSPEELGLTREEILKLAALPSSDTSAAA